MPLFRETEPETFVQWLGEPLPTTLQREVPALDGEGEPVLGEDGRPLMDLEDYVDDVRHPLAVEQLWSDEELLAIGLYRPAAADAVPEGKSVIATGVQRVAGVVKYVHELADAPAPTAEQVDMERDRRVAGGFEFSGVRYQSRQGDRENIAGASVAALAAMMAGVQPGNLRWHGGASDFAWIAEDNSLTPMDAQTMFVFGQAAMAHKQRLIFAARALKDADPIPADYTDESYWT